MTVTIEGRTYYYGFQHITTESGLMEHFLNEAYTSLWDEESGVELFRKAIGLTLCYISQAGDYEESPSGFALCKEGDHYDKEIGRRRALTSALRRLFPTNPSIRAAFWTDYQAGRSHFRKVEVCQP